MSELNPFQPPVLDRAPLDAELASLSARLVAMLVDLAFGLLPAVMWLVYVVLLAGTRGVQALLEERFDAELLLQIGMSSLVALAVLVLVQVVQAVLIAARGQTIGKVLTGCRIVRLDGGPVGFFWGVVVRTWVPAFLITVANVVGAGILIWAVDLMFAFQQDRRCGHDHLARTKVVRA